MAIEVLVCKPEMGWMMRTVIERCWLRFVRSFVRSIVDFMCPITGNGMKISSVSVFFDIV